MAPVQNTSVPAILFKIEVDNIWNSRIYYFSLNIAYKTFKLDVKIGTNQIVIYLSILFIIRNFQPVELIQTIAVFIPNKNVIRICL